MLYYLQVKAEKPAWYLAVISGALLRCQDQVNTRSGEYLGYLEKGQLPPARLTLTSFTDSLVIEGKPRGLLCTLGKHSKIALQVAYAYIT